MVPSNPATKTIDYRLASGAEPMGWDETSISHYYFTPAVSYLRSLSSRITSIFHFSISYKG
jgi:hypothetical protein